MSAMIFNQTADDRKVRSFTLQPSFVENYQDKQPAWGPIGYFTFKRTYARATENGGTEEFWQTVQRVVEGCFNIQKIHCKQMGLPWKEDKLYYVNESEIQATLDKSFTGFIHRIFSSQQEERLLQED